MGMPSSVQGPATGPGIQKQRDFRPLRPNSVNGHPDGRHSGTDDAVISKCRKGGPVTGIFELFTDGQANVRFRLVDSEGRELAVSCSYVDKDSAVRGISRVRECAGMGLVQDHCLPMSPADTKTADSRLL